MRKAGGILGIIGGVFAVIAALFTLFLGGVGGALQAQGAQTVIGLGWLGLLAAFLAIVFGAVVLGTRSKVPGVLLLLSAVLGITGGTPVAICMVLVGIGGLLAIFGASGAQASAGTVPVALDGASAPARRKVWRVVGGVVGVIVVLVVIAAALGSQSASQDAKTAAASDTASDRPASAAAPVPASSHSTVVPAPHFVVGDTFRTPTFRVQVGSARLLDQVGGQFLNDQAAAGAVYVAVAYAYENISDKPANVFAVPSVHLVDGRGTVYDPDVEASSLYASQIHATAKAMSNLNPGITLTDGDVFEVSRAQFDPRTWKILVKSGDGNVTVDFPTAGAAASRPQPAPSAAASGVASGVVASQAPAPTQPAMTGGPVPENTEVAVPGTIRIGQGKLAGGAYTYLHLDQPIPSPCGGDPVQDVLLWNASIGDPMMLKAYAGQHVVVHGAFDCPVSGIQFAPDSGTTP